MISKDHISALRNQAMDLKLARNFAGMLPLCEEIVRLREAGNCSAKEVANALNYLAALNLQLRHYADAERCARRSVAYYEQQDGKNRETLATYLSLLVTILAFQGRLDEAIPYAEKAVAEFSVFHSPKDDFLRSQKTILENLRNGNVEWLKNWKF